MRTPRNELALYLYGQYIRLCSVKLCRQLRFKLRNLLIYGICNHKECFLTKTKLNREINSNSIQKFIEFSLFERRIGL